MRACAHQQAAAPPPPPPARPLAYAWPFTWESKEIFDPQSSGNQRPIMVMVTTNYGSIDEHNRKGESIADLENSEEGGRKSSTEALSPLLVLVVTSIALIFSVLLFITNPHRETALAPTPPHAKNIRSMSTTNRTSTSTYPHRPFGTRNGRNVTLPVLGFPSVALARLPQSEQAAADEAVRHAAVDLGIAYFDVAPEYGDGVAQERLGPALRPYREGVFLAAKTMYRDAAGAATDMENTLSALRTDRLDLYQFHSVSTERDVEEILGKGGAMETFQRAKKEGRIKAIGFSAHSEPMAVRMIETGLVDTCMFPVNFAAWTYGGVGKAVLDAAIKNGVGVIALKAGARGRLTYENGDAVKVPEAGTFRHIPEWKREEMIDYPVVTSKEHPTCWYEPEDDPEELNKLILWSLNRPGVTAVLPPGDLDLLDGIASMLRGKSEVPPFDEADLQHMLDRYKDIVPIFHNRDESGTKVST